MKELHIAALRRAYKTFIQTLLATIPTGFTVDFVAGIDFKVAGLTILGMICTALISACISFLWNIYNGLPEVENDSYDELELLRIEAENELDPDCKACDRTDLECDNQCKEA